MKKTIITLILFLAPFIFISCGGSDDTDTPPEIMVSPDPIPNKVSTYTVDVAPIMTAHCIECHSEEPTRGAPMSLVTYQNVVEAVNNRGLFNRIATTNPFNVMPQSGRLPNATILKVEDWIADGLME